jgi:anion-transporting  ArsA/GET3 family ATPase
MQRLEQLELLIVTGKGGVGKSLLTAALGRMLSAHGRRVLLIEIDPRENLHHLLDAPPSGGEIVQVAPTLYLQHLHPRSVLDDLVRDKLKIGVLVKRVLESPVHQHFTEGAPGLKEAGVFGRILRLLLGHHTGDHPTPEVILLDAPATGHGVSLMAAPELVADVIQSGPIGSMAAEIASFMRDQERCGVVAVTTAEEIPVQEAIELLQELDQRLDRRPEVMVVNALYPPVPDDVDVHDDQAAALWSLRRGVNDRELERLAEHWTGPTVELPLLPIDPGPSLVGAIGSRLEQQLHRMGERS